MNFELVIPLGILTAFLVVLALKLVYEYSRPNGLLTKRAMRRRTKWAEGIVEREWLVREPMGYSRKFGFDSLTLESHDAKRKKLELKFQMDHPDYQVLTGLVGMDVVVFAHRSDPGMQWSAKKDFCAFLHLDRSHHWP